MWHVLLYYKLTPIQHPENVVKIHKEVCKALGLVGRILIGPDGINGTVGGTPESIERYIAYCNVTRPFTDIDFKVSTSEIAPFPRLKVRARKEIITTDDRDHFVLGERAKHVDRDTFHDWLKKDEDMVLLDMRNDYEWEVGRFVNSVRPPMKYFRDLKENMEFYEQFKDKKIVTFCTGGIRCEPATAMLIANGFDKKNLYQLDGGIVKYADKYGDEGYYEGKCFVFDDRLAVPVNMTESAVVVGKCLLCETACDTYRNCSNKYCNKLFLGCESCMQQLENTCSEACQTIATNEEARRPVAANHVMLHRNK